MFANMQSQFLSYQLMALANQNTKRQRFTPDEDTLIKKLADDKKLSWDEIAKQLPGRTGRQCKDRYNNYLNKVVVNKEWTQEEDEVIIQKYKELGPRWTAISNYLECRSGNNVKNRWYKYILKHTDNITTTATLPRRNKSRQESSQSSGSEVSETAAIDEIDFDNDFDSFFIDQSFDNFSLY